jgi:integrase
MKVRQKAVVRTRVKVQKGRYLVKKGEVWYLETCRKGVQRRRSLGTTDEDKAYELQKSLVSAEDELPQPQASRPKAETPSLTLGKVLEEYKTWYEKNKRASGARRALPVVGWFVGSIGKDVDVRAVTREHVQQWVDGRVDGRTGVTVRNDFARVRAFLRWIAARKGVVDWNLTRGIEKPKDVEVTAEAPSAEKVRAVLAKLQSHSWVGDYCRVLAETGMRPAELLGVRGIDLQEKGRLLSIVPWEKRELKSKWSKRKIELNQTAYEILKARVDVMFKRELPIFATELGKMYQPNSALHLFKKVLKGDKKEIPEPLQMTLYGFRHYFCSEHAAPGPQHMELEALAAYIGHSPKSRETLMRWSVDQVALRRGAPPGLTEAPKEAHVVPLGLIILASSESGMAKWAPASHGREEARGRFPL